MTILDLVFPKRCVSCRKIGDFLCANCFARLSFDVADLCLYCKKPAVLGMTHPTCRRNRRIDGCFSIVSYNRVAKRLIYSFKYKPYVSKLAEFLGQLFYEGALQKEGFMRVLKSPAIFVPIPLYSSRERERGYNHAEILANELSKRLGLPNSDVLIRNKNTKTQFKLDKEERKGNVKGAFSLRPNIPISQYPNIFLVDDILTTGATIVEAGELLKKGGAKAVFGLTFARD